MEISTPNIQLSSFKQAEDFTDEGLILRIYNIKQESSEATIKFHFDIENIQFCDLKEDLLIEQPEYSFTDNMLKFQLGAWKIATVKIKAKK